MPKNLPGHWCTWWEGVFKIEVFNALQTRSFGPSKYTIPLSKPSSLQNATHPKLKNEDVTWSPQYNMPATRTNKHCRALPLQEVEVDAWFLSLHIVQEHVYHIIHAQVQCEFCISFVYIFLDGRLVFEPARQLNDWNLRALQNETHMRASILNTDCCAHGERKLARASLTLKGQCKPHGLGIILGESCSKLLLHCTKWGFRMPSRAPYKDLYFFRIEPK